MDDDDSLGGVSSLSSEDETVGVDWYSVLQATAKERRKKKPLWTAPTVVALAGSARNCHVTVDDKTTIEAGAWRRVYSVGGGDVVAPLCAALCPATHSRGVPTNVVFVLGGGNLYDKAGPVASLVDDVAARAKIGVPVLLGILSIENGVVKEFVPPADARKNKRMLEHAGWSTAGIVVFTVSLEARKVFFVQMPTLQALTATLRNACGLDDRVGDSTSALARLVYDAAKKPLVAVVAGPTTLPVLEWAHRSPSVAVAATWTALEAARADRAALDCVLARLKPPTVAELQRRDPPAAVTRRWPPAPVDDRRHVVVDHDADIPTHVLRPPSVLREEDDVASNDDEPPPESHVADNDHREAQQPVSPADSSEPPREAPRPVAVVQETPRRREEEQPRVVVREQQLVIKEEPKVVERRVAVEELAATVRETEETRRAERALREQAREATELRAELREATRSARHAAEAARAEAELRRRAETAEIELAATARKHKRKASKLQLELKHAKESQDTLSSTALAELERRASLLETELEASRARAEAERQARVEARRDAEKERQAARHAVDQVRESATRELEDALREVRDSVCTQSDAARRALRDLADERDGAADDRAKLETQLADAMARHAALQTDHAALRRELARTKARLLKAERPARAADEAREAEAREKEARDREAQEAREREAAREAREKEAKEAREAREKALEKSLKQRDRELDELRASSRREAAALWLAVSQGRTIQAPPPALTAPPPQEDADDNMETTLETDLDGLDAKLAAIGRPRKKEAATTVERVERTNRDVLDFLELSSSTQPRVLSPSRVLARDDSTLASSTASEQPAPPPPPEEPTRPPPPTSAKPQRRGSSSFRTPQQLTVHSFPSTLRSSDDRRSNTGTSTNTRRRPRRFAPA